MQKPATGQSRGNCKKALLKANFSNSQPENQPLSAEKQQIGGKTCLHCGNQFSLNVVAERKGSFKYLRAGCCDAPLRECPNALKLSKSPHLTQEQRNYCARVARLQWFGACVASVLLQLEQIAIGGCDE